MSRRLRNTVLLAILVVLLAAAGCSRQTETTTAQPSGASASAPGPAGEKPTIALIMKSLANEFFGTMEDGARQHQQEHAGEYELIANGIKDEQDVARQIDLVEQMIAQQVEAIVIAPADSKALVSACGKAVEAGIVVVNIDNRFNAEALADKELAVPFVGPDNRKGARLAGEVLAEALEPGDGIAIIEGAPNAYNAVQRKLGFEDAAEAGGLKIVTSQTARWEMAKANQLVASIVAEHAEIKGIMCANDSMALGAVAALKAAGKQDEVLVVGFDSISAVQKLVREGEVLATVDQHAEQLAVFGIEYALEMLKTGGTPADRETPVDLITRDTLS